MRRMLAAMVVAMVVGACSGGGSKDVVEGEVTGDETAPKDDTQVEDLGGKEDVPATGDGLGSDLAADQSQDTLAADAGYETVDATEVGGETVDAAEVALPGDTGNDQPADLAEDAAPDVADDVAVSACPQEAPVGMAATCAGELHCTYGTECCCGTCYDSLVCDCQAGGQFGCYYTDACLGPWCKVPPCCEAADPDACQMGDTILTCADPDGDGVGKCVDPPPAGSCWTDADCVEGETCTGAGMCPCDADCDGIDMLGVCGSPAGLGEPCGPDGGECIEGLACCYPCGIPDCQWKCEVPCDPSEPWCANGCAMVP